MKSGIPAATTDARRNHTVRADSGRALEQAVVQAVAYADVFDYPLTADEIQRYLIGMEASRGNVRAVLSTSSLLARQLSHNGRYFTLVGREECVDTRRARAAKAAGYWRRAVRYGRALGNVPFVRMVAVTGALAMDNMADSDIDFLLVTEPGRLWLCRALVVGLVRAAAVRKIELCPNYFLSEQALTLTERNLFTAHELTQMVPLTGSATYNRLRDLNRWTYSFLPNASGAPRRLATNEHRPGWRRRLAERTLRGPLGAPIENWEMHRKLTKLGRQGDGHAEATFGPDWCKGHFGDHGLLTLARYEDRLRALGQEATGQ